MRAIKRHWRWALASTLVCTVLLLAWATQPPEKDLLGRATRISGVQTNQGLHPYGWISGRELLLFHFHPDGFWSVGRFDVITGREKASPALSDLYKRSGGDENGSLPRISPDGKHFLWTNRKSQIFCSDLEGRTFTYQFQKCGPASPCWLDNEHWAFLIDDKNDIHLLAVEAHDIRPPYAVRDVWFSPPIMLRSSKRTGFPHFILTPDRRLFVTFGDPAYSSDPVRVNEFAAISRHMTGQTCFLPLPQEPCRPSLMASTQSPVDGRVAFALLFQPNPPPWGMLLRFLRMRDMPDATGRLCVGDPATGKVHEVGRIVVHGFVGYGPIGDIRWLPDGKHLSFTHSGALYVVPAGT